MKSVIETVNSFVTVRRGAVAGTVTGQVVNSLAGTVARTVVVAALAVLLAALSGCKSGELSRRDIYLNLMTPEESARFREMEKTEVDEDVRVLFCQETGVFQTWQAAPPERQKIVRQGRPVVGMTPDELRMVWGPPQRRDDISSAEDQAAARKMELWSFDRTVDKKGDITYPRQAIFQDGALQSYKGTRPKPPRRWFGMFSKN